MVVVVVVVVMVVAVDVIDCWSSIMAILVVQDTDPGYTLVWVVRTLSWTSFRSGANKIGLQNQQDGNNLAQGQQPARPAQRSSSVFPAFLATLYGGRGDQIKFIGGKVGIWSYVSFYQVGNNLIVGQTVLADLLSWLHTSFNPGYQSK